jgi:hypothetical protein
VTLDKQIHVMNYLPLAVLRYYIVYVIIVCAIVERVL